MSEPILLSAARLSERIAAGEAIAVDCRFDLADTGKGRRDWLAGHVPGARYAHLDDDLSSPVLAHTGRHPLPDPDGFARFLSSIGWRPGLLLVAYDESSNAIAARLWWLMRYFGQAAGLLDGGLAAWRAAGLPPETGEPAVEPAPVPALRPDDGPVVTRAVRSVSPAPSSRSIRGPGTFPARSTVRSAATCGSTAASRIRPSFGSSSRICSRTSRARSSIPAARA